MAVYPAASLPCNAAPAPMDISRAIVLAHATATEQTDEIALNPAHLKERTTQETFSTLVHEMTHLEQHHFGQPSRNGYHNKQWAGLMKKGQPVIFPSETAQPGGKETGQRVSHYIVPGGLFDIACAELLNEGVSLDYVEMWSETDEGKKARKTKAASKTKYTCPACSLNASAEARCSPGLR